MEAVMPFIPEDFAAPHARRIEGLGTPEADWQAWLSHLACPVLSVEQLVPRARRLVVVAPHPDDEVLACGGLLAMRARLRRDAACNDSELHAGEVLVGVTDGEASHPGSRRWDAARLAARRREERRSGLRRLGVDPVVVALGLPDGSVAQHEAALASHLRDMLQPTDVVMTTWRFDGHPDHEATGRACARAAAERGATLIEMPVWAWHWAGPDDTLIPWHRLVCIPLGPQALERKREAIAAHRSQLQSDEDRPPVLFPSAVERLLRPFEYAFLAEAAE